MRRIVADATTLHVCALHYSGAVHTSAALFAPPTSAAMASKTANAISREISVFMPLMLTAAEVL